MKSLLALGLLFFALSFCLADDGNIQTAKLSPEHVTILKGGPETKWENQGITWALPSSGWDKMDVKKTMFMYGSVDAGFLIVNISTMPESFPSKISLDQTYKQALQHVENEKYERAQWLEIDGIKGVEWVEVMPEDEGDSRRHQWIAFREYKGKNQQLSIMIATKGSRFDAKRAIFAAIMYSMKFDKSL